MAEAIGEGYGFEDSLCAGCPSACCRDMIIPLSPEEAVRMKEAGTKLSRSLSTLAIRAIDGPQENQMYAMRGSCGNIREGDDGVTYCADYDNRPQACRNFKAGNRECDIRRIKSARESLPRVVPLPQGLFLPRRRRSVD